jgi:hypothetical protein
MLFRRSNELDPVPTVAALPPVAPVDDPLQFVGTKRPIAGDMEKVVCHARSPSSRVTCRANVR